MINSKTYRINGLPVMTVGDQESLKIIPHKDFIHQDKNTFKALFVGDEECLIQELDSSGCVPLKSFKEGALKILTQAAIEQVLVAFEIDCDLNLLKLEVPPLRVVSKASIEQSGNLEVAESPSILAIRSKEITELTNTLN